MTDTMPDRGTAASLLPRRISRRAFMIGAAAGSLAVVGGCSRSPGAIPVTPRAEAIELVEAKRPHTGRTVRATLTAQANTVDLGGPTARTLSYGAELPGPLVRANVGDQLEVTVTNGLDTPTSLHWHGLALRNDMDGAAPATPDIGSGSQFTYRFSVPHSGTYWAHP
ncbi:multicopper oxidase domain-containing protein, partial [Mycolicibacterium poriferae]